MSGLKDVSALVSQWATASPSPLPDGWTVTPRDDDACVFEIRIPDAGSLALIDVSCQLWSVQLSLGWLANPERMKEALVVLNASNQRQTMTGSLCYVDTTPVTGLHRVTLSITNAYDVGCTPSTDVVLYYLRCCIDNGCAVADALRLAEIPSRTSGRLRTRRCRCPRRPNRR
jgi:hypothetical protein